MFSLSPIYSACKSSNHKLPQNHKISPDTNLHNTYTNIKQNFRRISPFGIAPVKKTHKQIRLRHAGIVDHSFDISMPDFKKIEKEMDRSIKKKNLSQIFF